MSKIDWEKEKDKIRRSWRRMGFKDWKDMKVTNDDVLMHRSREVRMGSPPKSIGADRVLAHNHVQHTVDMPHGMNGFRAWTWKKGEVPSGFVKCKCGYAGLPHLHLRGASNKCVTWKEIHKNMRS